MLLQQLKKSVNENAEQNACENFARGYYDLFLSKRISAANAPLVVRKVKTMPNE